MARNKARNKLRAGRGAKASILTRMIQPKQPFPTRDHRSMVVLHEQFVDPKGKPCFSFYYEMDDGTGDPMFANLRWVKLIQEGKPEDLFDKTTATVIDDDDEQEPAIEWQFSKAKRLLYMDIINGVVPLEARDENNKSTMPLKEIYAMRPEYAEYAYHRFSARLSGVRKTIKAKDKRSDEDQKAYDLYVASHAVSFFTAQGYIQWQGSTAQKLAKEDIKAGRLDPRHEAFEGYRKVYNEQVEYHGNFPFKVFRNKIRQEIKTAKYIHTLKITGKQLNYYVTT